MYELCMYVLFHNRNKREAKIMRNFEYLIILIGFFNCIHFIWGDELLDLSCLSETQCMQFQYSGVRSSCIAEQCQCTSVSGENITCQPSHSSVNNIIGGPCPCIIPNTLCYDDFCYCNKSFTASDDKRRCILEKVALDEQCERDLQCQRSNFNSNCNEFKCRCMDRFAKYQGKCLSILGNKSSGMNKTVCDGYGEGAIYDKNSQHCLCKHGYVASNNNSVCLEMAKHSFSCIENAQCISTLGQGAVCSGNKCNCSTAHIAQVEQSVETETWCAPIVKHGDYCRYTTDCRHIKSDESQEPFDCIYGECHCKMGFHVDSDGYCIKDSGADIKSSSIPLKSIIGFLIFVNIYSQMPFI